MPRTCPHCGTALRPGEASLGWCGACGRSLRVSGTPGRPGGPAVTRTVWRWVARGALLKLVALALGAGGALTIAVAADWGLRRAIDDPLPAGLFALFAAAALDVVGRLLCLATPQGAARWLVVASLVCQLGAAGLALGAALSPPGYAGRQQAYAL